MSESVVDLFSLVGTTLEGKFRIERIVAEGGFGILYQGMHLTLDKPIALKVLKTPPDMSPENRGIWIEKFALEAKMIAKLDHPAIVGALDFGASDMPSGERAPWMVLEWITGRPLESVLRERANRPYTPRELIDLMKPAFEALAYAHEVGIAHRDIKPANMMVLEGRRGAQIKLLDFGIAKVMEPEEQAGSGATRTRSSMNAFSPGYAAPEQLSGGRTGPWTDVHAMGLVLSHMLTGLAPYGHAEDMTMLFSAVLNPQRPTPSMFGLNAGVWEPVIAKSLALRPDNRYQDAGAFLDALLAEVPAEVAGAASLAHGAVPPRNDSPTTLRGAAMTTAVPVEEKKSNSRAGLIAAVCVGLLTFGGGAALLVSRKAPATPTPVGQQSPATQPVAEKPAKETPPVQVKPDQSQPVVAAPVGAVATTPVVTPVAAVAAAGTPVTTANTGTASAPVAAASAPVAATTAPAARPTTRPRTGRKPPSGSGSTTRNTSESNGHTDID